MRLNPNSKIQKLTSEQRCESIATSYKACIDWFEKEYLMSVDVNVTSKSTFTWFPLKVGDMITSTGIKWAGSFDRLDSLPCPEDDDLLAYLKDVKKMFLYKSFIVENDEPWTPDEFVKKWGELESMNGYMGEFKTLKEATVYLVRNRGLTVSALETAIAFYNNKLWISDNEFDASYVAEIQGDHARYVEFDGEFIETDKTFDELETDHGMV